MKHIQWDKHLTLKETLPSLGQEARELIGRVSAMATQMFPDVKQLDPVFFYVTVNGKRELKLMQMDDETLKDLSFNYMRNVRATCPVAAFITEVWVSAMATEEATRLAKTNDREALRHLCLPEELMPRNCPDREEMASLTLWEGRRTVQFMAPIHRQPKRLGEWRVMHDSFTETNNKIGIVGRAVDGTAMPTDAN